MADNFKFFQGITYSLAGAGAVAGDTSITLKSMTDADGVALSMSGTFGTKGFGTMEPGNGENKEQISWTGLVNNANGTTTLTGVSSVTFAYPYTESSGLMKTHAGSTSFVVSNTSGFYNELTSKSDDETVTGVWTFTNPNYPRMDTATPPPVDQEQLATKDYVDNVAIAGAPDATNLIKGITKLSVAAASPTDPIAVGDNDPRVPTGLPVIVAEGGTGLSTLTAHAIMAGGTTPTGNMQQLGLGTTTTVLHGNATGLATFGSVDLTADVTGILPIANGGTGITTGGNRLIAQSVTPLTTDTSTTNENPWLSVSIPGGMLGTGNVVRLRMLGTTTNAGSGVGTSTFRIKYGGTTMVTSSGISVSSAPEVFVWEVDIHATGSVSSQTMSTVFIGSPANNTVTGAAFQGTGTATENSAGALNLAVTSQITNTSNAQQFIIKSYTIERLA